MCLITRNGPVGVDGERDECAEDEEEEQAEEGDPARGREVRGHACQRERPFFYTGNIFWAWISIGFELLKKGLWIQTCINRSIDELLRKKGGIKRPLLTQVENFVKFRQIELRYCQRITSESFAH